MAVAVRASTGQYSSTARVVNKNDVQSGRILSSRLALAPGEMVTATESQPDTKHQANRHPSRAYRVQSPDSIERPDQTIE